MGTLGIINLCGFADKMILNSPTIASTSKTAENLREIEKQMLAQFFTTFCGERSCDYEIIRKPLIINVGEKTLNITTHCISFVKSENGKNIICIHGANSGPASFINMCKSLLDLGYNVHLISLPGFGQSDVLDDILDLRDSSEIVEFYMDFLNKLINNVLQISPPTIIGRSFGGFLGGKFAEFYPKNVDRLILINSIGMLSTIGESGMIWGIIFKLGFPNRFFRQFGETINRMMYPSKMDDDALRKCWDNAQQTCEKNYGDCLVSKFITYNYYSAYWNQTSMRGFLNMGSRCALMWGYDDDIVPAHVARMCGNLTGANVYYMRGWHSPSNTDILTAFEHFLRGQQEINCYILSDDKMTAIEKISKSGIIELDFSESKKNIEDLYEQMKIHIDKDIFGKIYKISGDCVEEVVIDNTISFCQIKKILDAEFLSHSNVSDF